MDFEWWYKLKLTGEEVFEMLKYNLDLKYNGNRAPMVLVLHSEYYSDKEIFTPENYEER